MALMRQGLLWLSERQGIFNFVRRNGLARQFASRFVAGETIEDGVAAAQRAEPPRASPPRSTSWARASPRRRRPWPRRDQYLRMLDRMAAPGSR